MTLKSFRKVCTATKVYYTVCYRDGTHENFTVDYLVSTNKNILKVIELETEKTRITNITTTGGVLDIMLDVL